MTKPFFPDNPADPLVTTAEAARLLGVSLRSVQLWAEAGRLPFGCTPGGHRRIRLADIHRLAATLRPQGTTEQARADALTNQRLAELEALQVSTRATLDEIARAAGSTSLPPEARLAYIHNLVTTSPR